MAAYISTGDFKRGNGMYDYEKLKQNLRIFTESELFYKDRYEALGNPEKWDCFCKKYPKESILEKGWLCPEFFTDFTERSEFLPDDMSAYTDRDICLLQHPRYSPNVEHTHGFFEIFYVLEGSCLHTIQGRTERLPKGRLFFLAPGVRHHLEVYDNSIVINLLIKRKTFSDIFFNTLRVQGMLTSFFLNSMYTLNHWEGLYYDIEEQEIEELILSMLLEQLEEDSYSGGILTSLMTIFFAKLTRRYRTGEIVSSQESPVNTRSLDMITYINDHYQDITLQSLAKHFHYTQEYCSRLIKAAAGVSFTDVLRRIRLSRAEAFLLTTSYSIEAISHMVGYEEPGTFIRLFKKNYGISPGKYRLAQENL